MKEMLYTMSLGGNVTWILPCLYVKSQTEVRWVRRLGLGSNTLKFSRVMLMSSKDREALHQFPVVRRQEKEIDKG